MLWLAMGSSVVLLLGIFLSLMTVRAMGKFFQSQLEQTRTDHREQMRSWEVERERLMNRVMTKEWESYTQMTAQMQVAGSVSDTSPPVGLSDEREAEMWAQMHGGTEGIGEVFATLEDAEGLGLNG